MITTEKGIAILNSGETAEDHIKTILRFKNADNIEQLTSSEIKEVNEMLEDFKDAILNPMNPAEVDFHFEIILNNKSHEVYIGKVSKFDMSLNTLMQFEQLEVGRWDSIPYLLACVYTPVVNAMFNLKLPPGVMVHRLTLTFLQMDFKIIYGLYAFFLGYKMAYLLNSNLSIAQFEKRYRRSLKTLKKHLDITRNSGISSRRQRSKSYSQNMIGSNSFLHTLKMIIRLYIALGMARFMRFIMKRRRNTSKDV